MRSNLGLSLYLLAAGRRGTPSFAPGRAEPRPDGPLLWLNLPGSGALPAARELLRRLEDEVPDLTLLVTAPEGSDLPPNVIAHPSLAENQREIAAFIDHFRPDVACQIGGPLSVPLLEQIHRKAVPLYLLEADMKLSGAMRWVPGLAPALLKPCARILTPDMANTRALRRLGGSGLELETLGRMETGSGALPCTEAEREVMARLLSTRPAWLAAAVPEAELAAVIEAHRHALRMAHRLLLILVPEDPEAAPDFARRIREAYDWGVALRSADEDIDDECQVYIADTEGEFGLWYRLAPMSYMGGSLLGAGSLRAPGEPAALGSAIIHGPRTGAHSSSFAALGEARATRELKSPSELGEAVADLLAPDRAAQLAHNAWSVTSCGAEVTERILRLLIEAIDARTSP